MLSLCIEEVHERLNYCADASNWCMGISTIKRNDTTCIMKVVHGGADDTICIMKEVHGGTDDTICIMKVVHRVADDTTCIMKDVHGVADDTSCIISRFKLESTIQSVS